MKHIKPKGLQRMDIALSGWLMRSLQNRVFTTLEGALRKRNAWKHYKDCHDYKHGRSTHEPKRYKGPYPYWNDPSYRKDIKDRVFITENDSL